MSSFEMYPTIITPFLQDQTVDWDSLEKLICLFSEIGCDGIFAVCQSSEMFFLNDEEKIELARFCIAKCHSLNMKCVVSGHTQDTLPEQSAYLKKLEALQPDAIILVSNRLAAQNESETTAIANLKTLIEGLSPQTKLGIYECPYPYKRLLSDEMLRFMASDSRFLFIKDTCCKIDIIRHRLDVIKGSNIKLYNANMATLLESFDAGAAGYSGVMLNLMPEFFGILHRAFADEQRVRAERCLEYLSCASTIECQNYPANAKYILVKKGILQTTIVRNGKPPLNESQKKELDAFAIVNRHMYYALIKHEPYELVTGYGANFPECHAPTVVALDDGRVCVTYFAGTREKDDDVAIWFSVRENGVWKQPRLVAKVNDTAHWNPVIFSTEKGLRIVFKVGKSIDIWKSYSILSTDGGETWSAPTPFAADNDAGGPVRNKPLRLSSGELLGPNSDETADSWLPRIDISRDDGATFQRYAIIPINREDASADTYMEGKGAIQPTLWESTPGHIHALLRTTAGKIFRSDSDDNGQTWCVAYPTALPNNNSGIDVVNVGGTLYLAMNPNGKSWGPRTPIVIMRSLDNGVSFHDYRTLADDLIDDIHNRPGQFAYPGIIEKDGCLHVVFSHNRKSIAYSAIRL